MRRCSPGPSATWASASPRGFLARVSPGAAQAEPCNWRRSLQHSPYAGFPGSRDLEAGLPVTPAHPSAPPFLPPRRLLPAQGPGPGRDDAPRSTGRRSQGASSEPWEAPTLRPRGAGSRPGRGPRDPERPRESQSPPLGCRLGVCMPARNGSSRARPTGAGMVGFPLTHAGRRNSRVDLVGHPFLSLTLRGPGDTRPAATSPLQNRAQVGLLSCSCSRCLGGRRGLRVFPDSCKQENTHVLKGSEIFTRQNFLQGRGDIRKGLESQR